MNRDNVELFGFNGSNEVIQFSIPIVIKIGEAMVESKAYVVNNLAYDLIIGVQTLNKLGYRLVNVKENRSDSLNVATRINDGDPCLKNDATINTKEEAVSLFPTPLGHVSYSRYAVPFRLKHDAKLVQLKPYRLNREKYQWAQEKITQLLEKKIIRPSKSKFASPCVIVPKENGSLRLCQDYRAINKHTELDPFPFPIIDDLICNFGGCQFFTKLDLKDGFHQLPLTENTKQFTAFVLPFGHYEFNYLPFGWKNSPPVYQRFITTVLGDLLKDSLICAYIDDILIGGRTRTECAHKIYLVVKKLAENNLVINYEKSLFLQQEVTFLGRKIDGFAKTTKQESIEKVRAMKRPYDLHSLRVFTGLTGHFRAFIPNYAGIVRPLDRLKGKDVPFVWTNVEEEAFLTLIEKITSNPVLQLPDWELDFEFCTDASHYGCGAILYQRNKNLPKPKQLRVVGYFSHTFSSAEVNYSVTDKEALAVILAVKYFRSYLEGREFTVHTDHQALSHVMNLKEAKGRLARWQVFLMSYNVKINHRSGKELDDADAISRLCISPSSGLECFSVHTKRNGRIQIPLDEVPLILRTYHDDPESGGHDGFLRTYLKLKSRFIWPRMKESIKKYVSSCHVCQLVKFKFKPRPDFMVSTETSSVPFEAIHLDFAEVAKKAEGRKHTQSFLVVVDEFSRYVHAKAMKENSAAIVKYLKKLPSIDRVKRIISDNGAQFTSDEMKTFARERNIKLITTAPYHPEANGLAERKIRDIKQFLQLYPAFKGGWKGCLEAAVNHINRAYSAGIGCSPYFKLFGKVALTPADARYGISQEMLSEKPLTEDQQRKYKENLKKNFDKRHGCNNIPAISEESEILIQCGRKGKNMVVRGPFQVKKVITREGRPKTIIYHDEDGNEKVAALRNVVIYHSRRND